MGVIQRTLKEFIDLQKSGSNVSDFLDTIHDLDFISESLAVLGLRRDNLLNLEEMGGIDLTHNVITNQVVIDLEQFRVLEKLPKHFTVQVLKKLTDGKKTTEHVIKKTVDKYRSLNKNRGTDLSTVNNFLTSSFCFASKEMPLQKEQNEEQKTISNLKKNNDSLLVKQSTLEQQIEVLQKTVSELSKEKMNLLKAADKQESGKENNGAAEKLNVKQKVESLKLKRLSESQRKACSAADKKLEAQKELAVAGEKTIQSLKDDKEKITRELEKERRQNALLHQENCRLQDDFEQAQRKIETRMRENNRYTDDMRKTVLRLQGEGNVPSSKCSTVIKIVAENLFDCKLEDKDLPCLQTAINIADEGHVLSKIQIAESMLESQNITLHTDGTSRDQKKIISQQITLDTGETFSFGFYSVAAENSATLLEITCMQLNEVTELYSGYSEVDRDETFKQLLHKITSLMSDRAAVMKKFDSDFQQFIQTQLGEETFVHFVFCNAHFLLGLARSLETGLSEVEKTMENESGEKFGRDQQSKFSMFSSANKETATSRIIRTACDITGPRPDEKNGCRQEWLACCEEHGVRSYMTSYRSNRFNSFFEGAAAVLHHRAMLQDLLPSLGHSNLKIQSVASDLADHKLMVLVAAVALTYIRVTGPFWELLQSQTKNTEMNKYVKLLTGHMDLWAFDDASSFLDPDFVGVFEGEFELGPDKHALKQSVLQFVQDPETNQKLKDIVPKLMVELLNVAFKQLGDFLEGGKYGGPPAPFPEGLEHCPLTNLLGENVFGDFDFDLGKRRHASLHLRSSIHMAAHNRTGSWVSGKSQDESETLMAFARKKGKDLRKLHRQQEKLVMLKIREKLAENARQKILREAKQAEAKAKVIRRVAAHGGPCTSANDVFLLTRRLRSEKDSVLLEALKDEIRYQKTVLQKKGTLVLSGDIESLTAALQEHLSADDEGGDDNHDDQAMDIDVADPEDEEIPPKRMRMEEDEEDEEETGQFAFSSQGQWVAVYYDDRYYIGQVVATLEEGKKAMISYMEQSTPQRKCFKFPRREEVAETAAYFVFRWDFDVNPVGSCRSWEVPEIAEISARYDEIRARC